MKLNPSVLDSTSQIEDFSFFEISGPQFRLLAFDFIATDLSAIILHSLASIAPAEWGVLEIRNVRQKRMKRM